MGVRSSPFILSKAMLVSLARSAAVAARRASALSGSLPRVTCLSLPRLAQQQFRLAGSFKHREQASAGTFEFDATSENEIAFALSKYPDTLQGKQSGIMPLLWIVQQQLDRAHDTIKASSAEGAIDFPRSQGGGGWVPLAAMHAIAERLGCSHMDVYELGKFHIQLCATTPCMVCGAYDIMHAIEAHLGIKAGETSACGTWTLTEVECLGACVNAPMIQVNDFFFEDLTPENTVTLLDDLKEGRPVKIGPQNGRKNSLGPIGRTSLMGEPSGPQCRDFGTNAEAAPAAPK